MEKFVQNQDSDSFDTKVIPSTVVSVHSNWTVKEVNVVDSIVYFGSLIRRE